MLEAKRTGICDQCADEGGKGGEARQNSKPKHQATFLPLRSIARGYGKVRALSSVLGDHAELGNLAHLIRHRCCTERRDVARKRSKLHFRGCLAETMSKREVEEEVEVVVVVVVLVVE